MRFAGTFLAVFVSLSVSAFGQTEQIVNGGFENGFIGWTNEGPQYGIGEVASFNTQFAHTGGGYLKMGEVASITDVAAQTVTLPTNTIYAKLSYWHNLVGQVGGAGQFFVNVLTTNLTTLLTNVESVAINQGGTKGSNFYTFNSVDLTAFAGMTIAIEFELDTSGLGNGAYVALDDVSFQLATTADIPANDNFTNRTVLTGTNITRSENNFFATVEPGEPFHAGNSGGHSLWWTWMAPSDGILQVDTSGSDFLTLLGVYTGDAYGSLVRVASDNAFNEGTGFAHVKFAVHAGTNYQIAVDGYNDAFGTAQLNLHFVPDTTAPKVTISSPAANSKLFTDIVTFHGTASDNVAVAGVEFRLENVAGTNAYAPTIGANQWAALITNLVPGPNTLRVRAFDSAGNTSAPVTRTVSFVVTGNLTLATNGNGTITGVPRASLLVGDTYTISAKPAPNNLFSNWTGDVFSSNPKLTFIMQSNMTIQANFVTNVFLAVKGNYAGLITNADNTTSNAGYFTATISSAGSLTAKLMRTAGTVSLSAKINPDGSFSNNIASRNGPAFAFSGQVDLNGGDVITGQFATGDETSDLLANRAVFSKLNPCPLAGKRYTIVLPPGVESDDFPGGYGNATVAIDTSGNVTVSGAYGDNVKATPIKSFVSKDGLWAFFDNPYGKLGSILGWITYDMANPANPPAGDLSWLKLSNNVAKFYPRGFQEGITTFNSVYTGSNGAPIVSWTNGLAVLAGGNLSQTITNPFTIGANNKVFGSNGMTLTLTATTGAFKGAVKNGAKSVAISGAINQISDEGYGVFSGTNQTGSVILIPQE